MKEAIKAASKYLGGFSGYAASKLIPEIKKKKEEGGRNRERMLKLRSGLGKDVNTHDNGGKVCKKRYIK